MFGLLTEKFQGLFSKISGTKKLTEDNISEAVRDVRLALLDADVNYTVASQLVRKIKEKVVGEALIRSVTPGQQFVKIVHDELIALMGGVESHLVCKQNPSVILLCGLQGSGKTTQSAKLALFLKKKGKKVLLAACDLQRPAAVEQLKLLGSQIEVPVFSLVGISDPVQVAQEALVYAKKEGIDLLIIDSAGRLHIDEPLMEELERVRDAVSPEEILFVASAATGQDAVKTASEFDNRLGITGTILTMLDGNARAGAAISIREVTGKPLKFEGIGEKIADLQVFNPESMADRILGMGDMVNLVRLAKEHSEERNEEELEEKLRKASFTYEDYLKQMKMMKKMGPLKSLFKMMPGMSEMGSLDVSEKEFSKLESMILSMTVHERLEKVELIPSRRRRIASGSGTLIDDVNRMVKGFKQLKQFCKSMPNMKDLMKNMPKGKNLWQ